MALTPSFDAVQSLARELTTQGTAAGIIETLARNLKASFGPGGVAVGLRNSESGTITLAHCEGMSPAAAQSALELLAQGGKEGTPLASGALLRGGERILGAFLLDPADPAIAPGALQLFADLASAALIMERRLALAEASRHSWEATANAIPLALCIIDEHSRVRRANRAFADLLGRSVDLIVGRPWPALVPPGWVEGIGAALAPGAVRSEAELKAGERAFVVSAHPILGESAPTWLLMFENQTERRRLQSQLIQSEKMSAIGQLIAGVAHDLNNPLASVVGFADLLAEAEDAPARLREPLQVIRDEADRAAGIVRNLLSFARQQERQRRPTSLRRLLTSTLSLLRNQLMAQGVEVELELEPDLPEPSVDPNQIQQVFVNLISNAAQAIASTGRPGTVTVRGRRRDERITLEVIDDGPGMPPEVAARVFEPFYTTKPEGQGTGLGLSIGQGIVKEHGGRVFVTTSAGAGATFTVELPVGAPTVSDTGTHVVNVSPHPLRVLVIDDEPHILYYMRATLEAWGHEVAVAPDGEEGLGLALGREFDVIITDLRMPRLGGREFFERLQHQAPALISRLVFSTGDAIRGDTLVFLEERGRPCLHKPFSLSELRGVLAEVAGGTGAGTSAK
jgi:two-component system NtrC family sensor kinase